MPDARPPRLDSVDLLRGIAMVVMALDHVRDFFHYAKFDPLDLTQTTPLLFITRWITHHCAPTFVFLAGTGAFLSLGRGKTRPELARFLLSRGAWLVFLELTIVRFGWTFNLDYSFAVGQVIWAIGWSMIVLAGLVFLPRSGVLAVSLGLIGLHNFTDGLQPSDFGSLGWIWQILHVQSPIEYAPGKVFLVIYPLIPWIGVMGAGYAFGSVIQMEEKPRRKTLYRLGLGLIGLFILLRALNVYGDPHPWAVQSTTIRTLLSFIDTHKYPPSLLYVLMTLGPAIAVLPVLERWKGRVADAIIVFGRVPLFYYVLHIPLIHLLAVIAALLSGQNVSLLFGNMPPAMTEFAFGFSLKVVYAVWALVIFMLYFPCRWFMGVKRRRKEAWLSYL